MRAPTRLIKLHEECSRIFYDISPWISYLSSSQISPLRSAQKCSPQLHVFELEPGSKNLLFTDFRNIFAKLKILSTVYIFQVTNICENTL